MYSKIEQLFDPKTWWILFVSAAFTGILGLIFTGTSLYYHWPKHVEGPTVFTGIVFGVVVAINSENRASRLFWWYILAAFALHCILVVPIVDNRFPDVMDKHAHPLGLVALIGEGALLGSGYILLHYLRARSLRHKREIECTAGFRKL